MNTCGTFANRLALLRNQKGLSQVQLAKVLSDLSNRKRQYSVLTLSAWESGDKTPPLHLFSRLCDYFHISSDYLLGRSDDPGNRNAASTVPANCTSSRVPDYLVTYNELPKFDGEPIYVVFCDHRAQDMWGILDWDDRKICFSKSFMSISKQTKCIYYAQIPETQKAPKYNLKKRLSIKQVQAADQVWVEMVTSDSAIKAEYRGWFRNNETCTCLINSQGLTLPYDGLSISYNAFSSEF